MTVQNMKLTIWDFAIGLVRPPEIKFLQRVLIHKYYPWMPMRAVAEITGAKSHVSVYEAIEIVENERNLRFIAVQICKIIDALNSGVSFQIESITIDQRTRHTRKAA